MLGVVVAAAALVGGFAVAAGGSTPPTKTVTITASGCPGGAQFCFKPAALVVSSSTKVVWKNPTSAPHTVTRCTTAACGKPGAGTGTDPNLRSPLINQSRTFGFTFHHRGTYRYFCKVHGYVVMHGTITVR
jgi:plastocyanin